MRASGTAEIEERLAADPWTASGLLTTTQIRPWHLRLGSLMTTGAWLTAPILGVPDVGKAAEYYRDVLGFDLDPVDGIMQPVPGEPAVYALVKRAGCVLHLQIRRGPPAPRHRGAFERDVYFYVRAVEDLYAELQRRGARITQPPRTAPYGILELEVEDLNDYRLTFGEIRE